MRLAAVIPAFTLGLIAAANIVVGTVALGSFVYAGDLAPYSAQGIRLILLGCCLIALITALSSGLRGAVATPPAPLMIVMAGIGAGLAIQGDRLFVTMAAITALGALATGLCAALVGWFRLTHLVRFVPYPLACGFVSGTGAVAILVALSQLGVRLERETFGALFEPLALSRWGLGVAYGLGLLAATRRWKSPLILPASFAAAVALFHVSLTLFDVSTEEARTAGLLFAGMAEAPEGALLPLLYPDRLGLVDWAAVAGQVPNILALVVVGLLCLVIYLSGLELAANVELDWNREFRAMGLASMASGFGSGPPGCVVVPITLRNLRLGADTRLAGVFTALLVGAALLIGDAVLSLVPLPLIGGVLLFTGVIMLDEWLIKVRRRLPWPEFAIVVLIFLTILFFGFLVGVGVGAVVLVAFLLTRLASVDPVESRFDARERRSSRNRPVPERALLRLHGERAPVYRLRGYIFFGTAHTLADRLKRALGADPKPVCVLLDFGATTGVDVSAVNAIGRFILAADRAGTRVALSGTSKKLELGLKQSLPSSVHDDLLIADETDEALERCEDLLLAAHAQAPDDEPERVDSGLLEVVAADLAAYLDRQVLFEDLVADLDAWLAPTEFAAGETIVATGEKSPGALLLAAGRAALFDAAGSRLAECGPGDVIGGTGSGERGAPTEVRATEPCRALLLTPAAADWLEQHEAALMLRFYRYVVERSSS